MLRVAVYVFDLDAWVDLADAGGNLRDVGSEALHGVVSEIGRVEVVGGLE
tara:strand:- start:1299 stop:1448 length:150 start_codon:yes stop_codon:yes gene_type:complete